jgi:hypothetical protein
VPPISSFTSKAPVYLPVMQPVAKQCDPARLIWDRTPHQPNRGEHDSRAPVHRRLPALPWRSWTFSRSATMSTTKCRGAVAPALQAAPPLLSSADSQIVPRQRVSPATMAWDILSLDFAAIDIGEVDDRRTISTNHAPATTCLFGLPHQTARRSARLLRKLANRAPATTRIPVYSACSHSCRVSFAIVSHPSAS